MKSLTLIQPWATLVAIGEKRIETRSWFTNYRGPLAIHAARSFPKDAQVFALTNRHARRIFEERDLAGRIPLGAIVATCRLVDCLPTSALEAVRVSGRTAPHEEAFGDFSPGRWMWLLGDVEPL
ncbi:MAG: ASCH domain-containing protein, partial [Acidobacteria bacterium]|nr:ASCH domain-containing protein [Acidobacteriota bacterium]